MHHRTILAVLAAEEARFQDRRKEAAAALDQTRDAPTADGDQDSVVERARRIDQAERQLETATAALDAVLQVAKAVHSVAEKDRPQMRELADEPRARF